MLFLFILALAVNAFAEPQNAVNPYINGPSRPEGGAKLDRVIQPVHRIPRPLPSPSMIRPVSPTTPLVPVESTYIPRQSASPTNNRPYLQRSIQRPPNNGLIPASSEVPIVISTEQPAKVIQDPQPEILAPEIVTTEKVLENSQNPLLDNRPVYNGPFRPRTNLSPRPIPPPSSTLSRVLIPETTMTPTTESVVILEKKAEVPELPPSQEFPNPEMWPAIEPEDVVVEPNSDLPSSELPLVAEPEPEITTTLAPEPVPTTIRYPNRPNPSRPYPIQPEPKPRPSNPKWNNKPKDFRPSEPSVGLIASKPKPSVIASKVPAQINPIQDPMQYNFECTMLNGYFSLPNECDSYVECKKNVAYKYECPDGLHFNPNIMWPEYPCAFPSEVKCEGKNNNLPQPTSECPRRYGFFPMNDGSCGQYIMCQEGRATIMNCPPGLAFNLAESSCDWPINVPACNPNAFQGFSCPAPPMDGDTPSDLIYKYRYGNSCKEYVACQLGHPRLLSCDYGLSFDEYSEACIDSEYVENCKNLF